VSAGGETGKRAAVFRRNFKDLLIEKSDGAMTRRKRFFVNLQRKVFGRLPVACLAAPMFPVKKGAFGAGAIADNDYH